MFKRAKNMGARDKHRHSTVVLKDKKVVKTEC